MAAQITRRGFLAGLAATSALVAFPLPLRAQALPVSNEVSAVQRVASTAFKNYVGRVGASLSASQLTTITAAANDNLAAAAVRVGARSGVALLASFVGASAAPIVAGVVIAGAVAAAGYAIYKYWDTDREGTGGKHSVTTFEDGSLVSSSWSLNANDPGNNWYAFRQKQENGGWTVDWTWTPPSGETQADFDYLDVASNLEHSSNIDQVHAALASANSGAPVEEAWFSQALHALMVDTADQAAAAGTPLPEPFADPATVPAFVPADFPDDAPWPGPGAMIEPVPDASGSTSSPPLLISTPDPVEGGGTDPGTDPGEETPSDAVSIDWGEPPAVEQIPDVTPMSWFPNPFVAPQLSGTCSGWTIPAMPGFPVNIDPCPLMGDIVPVVRPVISVSATIAAGKVLLDI